MKKALTIREKFPCGILLIWFIFLAIVYIASQFLLPKQNQFSYVEPVKGGLFYLWSLANFDGIHYLSIAKSGYGLYQEAFFPLYPLLIKNLTTFFWDDGFLTGVAVAWGGIILAIVVFYKLASKHLSNMASRWSIIALLVFPTSFFFLCAYTESLFLLLILLCFYFAQSKKWFLAGIMGALASATRLPGIFLFPAILVEWWMETGSKTRKDIGEKFLTLLPICLIPAGLLFYLWFLWSRGDALAFIHVQPHFGANREVGRVILLYQVFWRYIKMLVTVEKFTPTYFVVVLEFLSGVASLIMIILAIIKKRFSYAVFMALSYVVPSLTGTFLSLPRFFLTFFPAFFIIGSVLEKHRWTRFAYLLLAAPLLAIGLVLFARGYWVA